MIKRRIRYFFLWVINHFLCGNHFWNLKNKLLRSVGMQIGKNVKIVGPLKIDSCSNLLIDDNTWIGKNFVVHGNADVIIGSNCDIAPEVICETGTHKVGESTRRAGTGFCEEIRIGNGCWIGVRTTILPGVKIETGSVVAAGAVVNKDIPKNVICGGVPAKIIKDIEVGED